MVKFTILTQLTQSTYMQLNRTDWLHFSERIAQFKYFEERLQYLW